MGVHQAEVSGEKGQFSTGTEDSASVNVLNTTNDETADGAFVVWWSEPEDQDPENPRNWSPFVKWSNILTIATISFLVFVDSSPHTMTRCQCAQHNR